MSMGNQRLIVWATLILVVFSAISRLDAQERETGQSGKNATKQDASRKNQGKSPQESKKLSVDDDPDAPFRQRFDIPDFPKGVQWLNTGRPLSKRDLKGKFVLLDFWTYCCINCIHILPELKKLEKKYPGKLVVIGVHSAKFETEKETKNIREAILRYEIEHPVINDFDHKVWDMYQARSWPSIRLLDPQGKLVAGHSGEIRFEDLDAFLKPAIEYYEKKGLLDDKPLKFKLEHEKEAATPLRFPGKIHADAKGKRLFITDSNHNRIVVTDLQGSLLEIIGSGRIGSRDGDFQTAEFDHPQGVFLHGSTLYVADTENHNLRKVDLNRKTVETIAGTGKQASRAFQHYNPEGDGFAQWAGPPKKTALNSPWALWVHGQDLFIAMAGPHQIWKMPLDESAIGPYAGNGREDIVDGPLLPSQPYGLGASSFAQPSGLASDGKWLYVADTEGSSIRAVPLDGKGQVRTVVGTSNERSGRLFIFGDQDGPKEKVLLQHAIGIAYDDGKLYVADTYNNKIKIVDASTGETRTLAGTGEAGRSDLEGTFDEPAGLAFVEGSLFVADTNNHLIRRVDPATGKVTTLEIRGLEPPKPAPLAKVSRIRFPKAPAVDSSVDVRPVDGTVTVRVRLIWPPGWKTNELAKMGYYVHFPAEKGVLDRTRISTEKIVLKKPANEFSVRLPVAGEGNDTLRIEVPYYYCQTGDSGICKAGTVAFNIKLTVDPDSDVKAATVEYDVPE